MDFTECFRLLAGRLREEIIVTSAGNCSELWWEITRETERVFYLDASMSLASLFAAGIALGISRNVVALSGDGAFCMNPGMLMVERAMALPNLKHFVVSNHCYGSTNELPLRFTEGADYAAMARAAGVERVYSFATVAGLGQALDEILGVAGHVFAVLEVEPLRRQLPSPPLDGPELKFRFGRYLERTVGRPIFDAPLYRSNDRGENSASI
jgi:sulfopyruvate decarboxylase subunit beta